MMRKLLLGVAIAYLSCGAFVGYAISTMPASTKACVVYATIMWLPVRQEIAPIPDWCWEGEG